LEGGKIDICLRSRSQQLNSSRTVRTQSALKIAICTGLVAVTFAVFGQTAGHDFVNFDDPLYVSGNTQIQSGVSWQNIRWAFTHVHSHNWHPLTTISHMLDCQLFGLKPGAHHLVNVLWHSASAVLLFVLLASATQRIWSSAFVAAIFAIHPLHVQSVAWIAERKDVLSGLFFVLTLLAYLHFARKPGLWRYLLVLILFAGGLLAKPMLVTVPLILLLLDYWPLGRSKRSEVGGQKSENGINWLRLILEKIPLFLLSIGSAVATLIAQRGGIVPTAELPLAWRISNAISAYLIYIWQTIWPAKLALFYPHPGDLPIEETLGASAILALVTAAAFMFRRRAPYLITGWFWYLVMLVPVVGLVQVGAQAHADRYMYLPQIGLCIAITWAAVDLVSRFQFRSEILGVVAPAIVVLFGWRAWIETTYWHDTERLWDRTLAVTGENDLAHFAMGEFFLNANRLDEAISQFQIVRARHPNDPAANFQLGSAHMEKGELELAAQNFEVALKAEPGNTEAETNLANVLLAGGHLDEALSHYRSVVTREPGSAQAHYNLAVGLHREGRLSEAILHYKEALRIDPRYPDAEYFLREALLQDGRADEARFYLPKH
jgi:protein O-mannosyl-transferase